MNTTEHYQLNQWEGSDRIMREDFNADNRKTEEALTELADTVAQKIGQAEVDATLKWVKIGESVLSGSGNGMSVTVENIQQYSCLLLLFDVKGGTKVSIKWTGGSTEYILLNGGWDPLERSFGGIFAQPLAGGGVFFWGGTDYLAGSGYGPSQGLLTGAATTGTVTVEVLAVTGNDASANAMESGSSLYVYGLRK